MSGIDDIKPNEEIAALSKNPHLLDDLLASLVKETQTQRELTQIHNKEIDKIRKDNAARMISIWVGIAVGAFSLLAALASLSFFAYTTSRNAGDALEMGRLTKATVESMGRDFASLKTAFDERTNSMKDTLNEIKNSTHR